jgi:hypothetical protein
MSPIKSVKPIESPADSDPLSRLIAVLQGEGFEALHDDEEWKVFGEKVYRRGEKILFASGETIFVVIDFPDVTDKVVGQAVESLGNLFRARTGKDRLLSPLQSTTVYVCIVAGNEIPMSINLARHITSVGGAVMIPVIIVPDINQVLYPASDEKIGSTRPRIEYLQYLLGERTEHVPMHRGTVQTIYITMAIALLIVVAVAFSFVT